MKNSTVLISAAVLILLLAGLVAYYFFYLVPTPAPTVLGNATTTPTWLTYSAPGGEFSIQYPPDFRVNTAHRSPSKGLSGVSFTIPPGMATGTNLSVDTYIAVLRGPDQASCTGADFINTTAPDVRVTEDGVAYLMNTTSDAGAGNLYEEIIYVLPDCYALHYVIHSTQIANYPEGSIRAFDRGDLVALFDQIRRTFRPAAKG